MKLWKDKIMRTCPPDDDFSRRRSATCHLNQLPLIDQNFRYRYDLLCVRDIHPSTRDLPSTPGKVVSKLATRRYGRSTIDEGDEAILRVEVGKEGERRGRASERR